MMFGLPDTTIQKIRLVLKDYPQVDQAILYGSRAKGNFKNGSDIDLTLHGEGLTLNVLYKILADFDNLLLPYQIDLSIFDDIENPDLMDHIQRVGISFYEKALLPERSIQKARGSLKGIDTEVNREDDRV